MTPHERWTEIGSETPRPCAATGHFQAGSGMTKDAQDWTSQWTVTVAIADQVASNRRQGIIDYMRVDTGKRTTRFTTKAHERSNKRILEWDETQSYHASPA